MSKAIIITYTGLESSDLIRQNIASAMYPLMAKGTTVDIVTLNDEELAKAIVKVAVKPVVRQAAKEISKYDAAANVLIEMFPKESFHDMIGATDMENFRRNCILKVYTIVDKTVKSKDDKALISAIKIIAETEGFNERLTDKNKSINPLVILELKSITSHFKL